MKIVTWNINSVRLRINHVKRLSVDEQPDVICLQETKAQDKDFPLEDLREFGYEHIVFRGEKSYNGVAIMSKLPLTNIQKLEIASSPDTRHISAMLPCGLEIHNFYIPAGGDEPDVEVNPKFKFKLEFIDYITDWFEQNRKTDDRIIILGDFNIAPLEHDVWSSKQLRNTVSHTQVEIARLNKLQQGLGWVDIARHFVNDNEKLYSWWSYRNRDWRKSNRGRRLDHIWATPALKEELKSHKVVSDTRDWEKPSDHAPVIVEI